MHGVGRQRFRIGRFQDEADAFGQTGSITRLGKVAILEMVYHFRYAAHAEAYAGRTARECFDDGVRQVVLERGSDKGVGRIVEAGHLTFIAHVTERIDGKGKEFAHLFRPAAHDNKPDLRCQPCVRLLQDAASLLQVADAFARVGCLERAKQQKFLVGRKIALQARLFFIGWAKDIGIDGIGHRGHLLPNEQGALPRQACHPLATAYKDNMCPAQHLLFAAEHLGGKVVRGTSARKQRAMMALGLIFRAFATVMANAGERPLVMQRPHDRFAAVNDAADVFQRKETLVHPMEMNEVGFLEFGKSRDVRTGVGQIYLKQVFAAETVGRPYHEAFPQELGAKLSRTNILAFMPLWFRASIRRCAAMAAPPALSDVLTIRTLIDMDIYVRLRVP